MTATLTRKRQAKTPPAAETKTNQPKPLKAMTLGELAEAITEQNFHLRAMGGAALQHAKRCGMLLSVAKGKHAEAQKQQAIFQTWEQWVPANCGGLSRSMADIYIRVAKNWPRIQAAMAQTGQESLTINGVLKLLRSKSIAQPNANPRPVLKSEDDLAALAKKHHLNVETGPLLDLIEDLLRHKGLAELIKAHKAEQERLAKEAKMTPEEKELALATQDFNEMILSGDLEGAIEAGIVEVDTFGVIPGSIPRRE